jgi:hypothetical protein
VLGRVVMMLASALVLGCSMQAAPALAAGLTGDVTMYSDPGDFVGGGVQHVYTPGNASMTVSGTASDLTVTISSDTGDDWSMVFAAPPGETIAPGDVYTDVGRAAFRGSGQAGIDIFGDGRGCNTDSGLLQVQDVDTAPDGAIDRLWLVYQQNCEGAGPALFGEVQLGEPGSAPVQASPAVVRWPEHAFRTPETTVPVQLTASSPATIKSVTLTGGDPFAFVIRSNGCKGATLAAGAGCDVYVDSTPFAAGTTNTTLQATTAGGQTIDVPLQSWTEGGATRLAMTSAAGDFVGGGGPYLFTPANSTIAAAGTPEVVSFSLGASNGDSWSGDFAAPQGKILSPGATYTDAQRYPFQGLGPGLSVYGDGRGCNTSTGRFTVTTATYSTEGVLETFGARFSQTCTGDTGALTGTFDWYAGSTTAPPPWGVPTS